MLCKTIHSDYLKEVSYYTQGDLDIRLGSLNCHGLGLMGTTTGLLKFTNIASVFLATTMEFLFLQDTQRLDEEGKTAFLTLGTIPPPS